MDRIFVFFSLVEMLLVVIAALFPGRKWSGRLPLGGSHIAQLGICLGCAFVLYEMFALWTKAA